MRTAPFVLAALLAGSGARADDRLFGDTGEGSATLAELLRLSRVDGLESAGAWLDDAAFTPRIGGVVSGSGIGLGFTQTLWKDPRSSIEWGALGTSEGYLRFHLTHETAIGASGRLRLRSGIRYRDLAQEDFFGLGLASSRTERTDFRLRETVVGSELDYALSPAIALRVFGDVRTMAASAGANDGLPAPLQRFAAGDLFGIDERFAYATFGASIARDTREPRGNPRRGSLVEGGVRQFHGLGSGDPGFRRFEVELQKAFPLPGHDHALVSRLRADWLDHDEDSRIPFFFTRGLGGSHTLRGYPLNRFRGEDLLAATLEYRSALLPEKLDFVLFWDAGGVYDRLGDVRLGDLRHAYGAGVRILRGDRVLLRLELAQGDEGLRFLVSFSKTF